MTWRIGNHGQFDDRLPPGDGRIAWPEIKRTLEQVGYAGWIILELKCPEEPLATYFARAFDQANRLLDGSGRGERAA